MKKQMIAGLMVLLLLVHSGCMKRGEPSNPAAPTLPNETYRSEKVTYEESLLSSAADVQTAGVWQAASPESCRAVFESVAGAPLQTRLVLEDAATTYREYACEDGELIWERQTDGQYSSGCYKKYDSDFYLRLITPLDSESVARHSYTVDRFPVDCDLENLRAADAKTALIDALALLGLQTDEAHITAYALQKEPLQTLAEERKADGLLDPIVWTDPDGNQIIKDPESWYKEFTEEDECFYLSAAVLVGGIPLFSSCNATALWGADGFLYLSLPCVLSAGEASETREILSAESAMSLLHTHYENNTIGVTAEVVCMELVYYPQQSGNGICLIPAWHFLTVEHRTDEETNDAVSNGADFYFDAASGELLTQQEEGTE